MKGSLAPDRTGPGRETAYQKEEIMTSRGTWHRIMAVAVAAVIVCTGQLTVMGGLPASAQTPEIAKPTSTLPASGAIIKLGYARSPTFAPFFVAIEKGFFQEQGLQMELEEFRSGSQMVPLLATGQLDIGGGEVGSALFNAVGQGLDVRAVATLSSAPPGSGGDAVVVRKDLFDSGQVTEIADLKGRRIAINMLRGIGEYIMSEALALGGLTPDDVQFVPLARPDMPAALANKAIDAAWIVYPFAAAAIEDDHAVSLLTGDQILDTPQISVMYFGKRLLEPANRELAIRFLVAYLKGARAMYGSGWRDEDNIAILSKYTGVDPDLFRKSVPSYCDPNGQMNRASMAKTQDYFVRRGYIESGQPLALSQVVDDTLLAEALDRLGPFQP